MAAGGPVIEARRRRPRSRGRRRGLVGRNLVVVFVVFVVVVAVIVAIALPTTTRSSSRSTPYDRAVVVVLAFSSSSRPIIPSSSRHTATTTTTKATTTPRSWRHGRLTSSRSPSSSRSSPSSRSRGGGAVVALRGGYGEAIGYSWTEDQFEMEVRVDVPPRTVASEVVFGCTSESIDLRLLPRRRGGGGDGGKKEEGEEVEEEDGAVVVLLDGSRRTRGRMCVDGTYWSMGDRRDDDDDDDDGRREIVVTIEKHFVPTSADRGTGTVTYDASTVFDWGGLYADEYDGEVTRRSYDEAEELDVREYAAKLGVDIDMSKVNKTMFGAGLGKDANVALDGSDDRAGRGGRLNEDGEGFHFDIDRVTLEQLARVGLAKEVVRQADGSEYELGTAGSVNGKKRAFSMLGRDVSDDELREAGIVTGDDGTFTEGTYDAVDSVSEADEVVEDEMAENEIVASKNSGVVDVSWTTGEEIVDDVGMAEEGIQNREDAEGDDASTTPRDPIDMLTVARLKEVLRAQGLKTSGTKRVLRDRLRGHVKSLLREE
ncbi:hypothetical protein ACHAW5_005818 [Stephanodiscus triporus]|uniref:SAP domain-containing protein n=1 Tax=Stephanodiscus triporus TaxID=2934178 RepID=A0ABD3PX36_9STRA